MELPSEVWKRRVVLVTPTCQTSLMASVRHVAAYACGLPVSGTADHAALFCLGEEEAEWGMRMAILIEVWIGVSEVGFVVDRLRQTVRRCPLVGCNVVSAFPRDVPG